MPLAALYVHRREVFNPFYQVAGYNRNGDWGDRNILSRNSSDENLMKQISESDSDAKDGKVREIKWWNDNSIMEQNGVYLHGVCEPEGLYIEGRRSIKEAIFCMQTFAKIEERLFIVQGLT